LNPERLTILPFLQQSQTALLLDVRSPAEYQHAHVPGAVSLPLFTDEERKEVGTTYKQVSREQAIKIGLDFFGPKMRSMVETVEALAHEKNTRQLYIYCWRGGMRSAAVAWLLNLYGFKVKALNGGYKAFRNYVLHLFTLPYSFKILGGYTGSGKTELLHELQGRGERVIDLETLAAHKGSAFGNISMPPQPTQEMFENKLAVALYTCFELQQYNTTELETFKTPYDSNEPFFTKSVWLEDESQRIGHINLPGAFWNTMRHAPIYFLDIPFEERLKHLVEEYGTLDKERMTDAIIRITKRLGSLEARKAIEFLEQENISESFRILLQYYDKHYLKALNKRENIPAQLNKIPCNSVDKTNVQWLIPKPMIA
jgi:tRNA 2-selenouridine synthase